MDLREWLITAGIVLVVLILIDGWRRIGGRGNKIKMKIDRSYEGLDDSLDSDDKNNAELPNGGARVKLDNDAPDIDKLMAEEAGSVSKKSERIEPEYTSVDDVIPDPFERYTEQTELSDPFNDEGVVSAPRKASAKTEPVAEESEQPVIDEPVDLEVPQDELSEKAAAVDAVSEVAEPEADEQISVEEEIVDVAVEEPSSATDNQDDTEKKEGFVDDLFGLDLDRPIHELVDAGSKSSKKPRKARTSRKASIEAESSAAFDELLTPRDEQAAEEPLLDIESLVADSELAESVETSTSDEVAEESANYDVQDAAVVHGRKERELDLTDAETRLVLFVVAPKGGVMLGSDIRTIIEKCGMEFGQMDLFHRFEDNSDNSPIQFSMSDVQGTGSFDLNSLETLETPAVSFFMSMREPRDPSYAVDCMLATAETLAKALKCEMLDGDRSVMRPQTQEHYRELVKAFKLKERAKSRRTSRKSK